MEWIYREVAVAQAVLTDLREMLILGVFRE